MEFKHQKDLGPDAIQKWCEELDRKPKRELTPEEGKTLFMCMINEPHYRTDKNFESLLGKCNGVAILHDRIKENHTYTIENAVLLFLGSVIDRPGIAVQYANFMQYKCWQYHIKHVDMKSFARRILPAGLLTEDALYEMWDKQKYISEKERGLLNMLDNAYFMQSIREIKEK